MEITIDGRIISPEHPPYVICELSGNHNGSLDRAMELLEAAAATGCDAIKLQTYSADTMTLKSDKPDFKVNGGLWDGYTLHELYSEASTPYEWHAELFQKARELGVTIFSTPFDETAVDLLESLGAPAYKIASFEIVDLPLIEYVAARKKPMIISTGLANLSEIGAAVETARAAGCSEIILLHCVSSYPSPIEQSNVLTVPDLGDKFSTISGLSDHTYGSVVSVAAVSVGACVIEKHFTLRRSDGGPDADFSLEPDEFKKLVTDCKQAWSSLGAASYEIKEAEKSNFIFRRSLYVVDNIKKGEQFTENNIRSIRPGYGMSVSELPQVIGKRAAKNIDRGEALSKSMIVD